MPITDPKAKLIESNSTNKLPHYEIISGFTLRVICCAVFIFLTEICVAHYIYRLLKSEINEDFIAKHDFNQEFMNAIRRGIAKEEIRRILSELEFRDYENARTNATRRRKRDAFLVNNGHLSNSPHEGPSVEFFDPKLRGELEAKDAIERGKYGNKGDPWVWLTSYCRIPMPAMQGFCSATKEYCPAGPPGPDGLRGTPGGKGERGDRGLPGIPGPIGTRGYPGTPGQKGIQGTKGLPGNDGVPGEPGFDGKPCRNGYDGFPGMDGRPGDRGIDGRNGTDGLPGMMGPPGPQGPPGQKGEKGLHGPRGNTGLPGNHGSPGIPGIDAWRTTVKGSVELLIAPSIAGNTYGSSKAAIIVYEGENVRLRCAVSGKPIPRVEWRRTDGQLIHAGTHKAISIPGESLNLTRINRVHMGSYQCIADNGIPPQANHTFHLKVHFPPLIRLRSQIIGAEIGSFAILECEVEAFPESVTYWERADGRLLENGTIKYLIWYSTLPDFKAIMTLNITSINTNDLTTYYCISKNERGITRGALTVYEAEPGLATPSSSLDGKVVTVFGVLPPEVVSSEQLCPPIAECKKCPEVTYVTKNCTGTGFLFDLIYRWEIIPLGRKKYKELPKRNQDCVLEAIGKPVYHGYVKNQPHGSWMMDSNPANDREGNKFWMTNESDPDMLYEYSSKGNLTQRYKLLHPFHGNAHVVYNGSFYYHAEGKPQIIRYVLNNRTSHQLNVTELIMNSNNTLYKTRYNYLDFSVDDNGLWVIFPVPESNNTAVMKVDVDHMSIQKAWNFSLEHQKVGEMFVMCGVLYAIDSVSTYRTKVRFALDLYRERLVEINLDFTNPFERTTMVGYNHRKEEIYTWDKGNQLRYPVRYHAA